MKPLLLVLAALLAITLWFRHDNVNLSYSLAKANQIARDQKNTINTLLQQLSEAQRIARSNEDAQVRLREDLAAVGEEMARREAAIGKWVNENEELRRWYNAQLPDAVRRLHTRAACASASAAHCLQRLPEGERLSDAGQ
ncbi:Rz-like lysis system protein LysB [Enterobacter ludwigii]|jgi:LysB family phage lysis regulatory protein|uniref:Rz-like lysis system protein LysB n=1 Tax=Enterobacter ludwigii TaxID=299767 RepID=UPI0022E07196|nr:Rz-like lysis system protein LysB [Enterobacter ludwigii]HDU8902925.1 LysB family phage lysis regulatory protein [Enterobacter ludwigii]